MMKIIMKILYVALNLSYLIVIISSIVLLYQNEFNVIAMALLLTSTFACAMGLYNHKTIINKLL